MENNIIILEDENGSEVEFEVIDVFELDNITFFAMVDDPESDEVLIMQVEGDINSEDAQLVMIEDEDLLAKAFNEFVKRDEESNAE